MRDDHSNLNSRAHTSRATPLNNLIHRARGIPVVNQREDHLDNNRAVRQLQESTSLSVPNRDPAALYQ